MRILVTGATGFLGSHIIRILLKEGYEVIILKRSFSDIWRIKNEIDQVNVYDIDKCSLETPFLEQGNIDAVIHTATCYGRNGESLNQVYQTNVSFPLELLEIAALFNTKAFFNTDTVLYKYLNYYSLSKKQFLEWGRILAKEGKINFVNMKLEHIYGLQDDASKFVGYVIKQCRDNVKELNLTKGEQKRDFIYIDDVVNAYAVILQNKRYIRGFVEYAVGTGETVSIKYFVELVRQLTNSHTKLNFGAIPYRENEIMESKSNIESLTNLGWKPEITLQQGISKMLKKI